MQPRTTVRESAASARIAPSTTPTHGAAQTANAAPSRAREPLARARVSAPGASMRSGQGSSPMKREPEHDEHEAGDLRPRLLVDPAAERRRAGAEDDEDDREAERERHARGDHPSGHPALAEPVDLDRRDRGQVAGDERQHAGEGDRDEARGERCRDPLSHRSGRAPRRAGAPRPARAGARSATSAAAPAPARARGSSARRARRAPPRPPSTPTIGSSQASRSNPCRGGAARIRCAPLRDELVLDLAAGRALPDPTLDVRLDPLRRRASRTARASRPRRSGTSAGPRARRASGAARSPPPARPAPAPASDERRASLMTRSACSTPSWMSAAFTCPARARRPCRAGR